MTTLSTSSYATPQVGGSLLLSFSPPRPSTSTGRGRRGTPATRTVPARQTVLVVGGSRLAAARALTCLEAGYRVVLALDGITPVDPELRHRLATGEVASVPVGAHADGEDWLAWLDGLPFQNDISFVCFAETGFFASSSSADLDCSDVATACREACFARRIPLNVANRPHLSDFAFPVTYRWPSSEVESKAPLQLAIATSASSCRLAVRLRREIVSKVSREAGVACEAISELRKRARQLGQVEAGLEDPTCRVRRCSRSRRRSTEGRWRAHSTEREEDIISGGAGSHALNRPVTQLSHLVNKSSSLPMTPPLTPPDSTSSSPLLGSPLSPLPAESVSALASVASREDLANLALETRMRWIAQISEYWALDRIAALVKDEAQMAKVLQVFPNHLAASTFPASAPSPHSTEAPAMSSSTSQSAQQPSGAGPSDSFLEPAASPRHGLEVSVPDATGPTRRGRILLVGSGPGHPGLLTMAAHAALTQSATVVLSDKLVPAEVLALVPPTTKLYIAKKYPGNAEGAQNELMEMALEGAKNGEVVVRLKQGDPYLYGRGGEEVLFFRAHGYECTVIPGVSSALAAPLMVGIPVTQRGAAESLVICTGVGRKGKGVRLPGYERPRSLVVLMGVARLESVVNTLVAAQVEGRAGPAYPRHLPIAIIERASSPDQRLVASTLDRIVDALARAGEQRPPGMMMIGWSVLALEGQGDVEVLDGVEGMDEQERDEADRKRVDRWLGGKDFLVREGLCEEWNTLMGQVTGNATATEVAV